MIRKRTKTNYDGGAGDENGRRGCGRKDGDGGEVNMLMVEVLI